MDRFLCSLSLLYCGTDSTYMYVIQSTDNTTTKVILLKLFRVSCWMLFVI